MDPPGSRADLERRICEAIERGWTLQALEAQPGFPSRRTVSRWSRQSPVLAEALRQAREWRRGVLVERWQRPFDGTRAAALLQRIRCGEAVEDLLRDPAFPRRRTLNHWRRLRPDFAEALAAAVRDTSRPRRTGGRAYDEAAADGVICRLAAGDRMAEALRAPGSPGLSVLTRWRKARPELDHAVRMALISGRRRRAAGRGGPAPDLAETICRRVADGATIDALGAERGLPHRATLHRWLRRDPDFADQVRVARMARDDPLADEVLAIAERATPETLEDARARIAEIKRVLGRRAVKRRGSRRSARIADI